MGEREETGSDNRAFLDFYGTTLPRVERQNRGEGYREHIRMLCRFCAFFYSLGLQA
jgi:hypothetical protein